MSDECKHMEQRSGIQFLAQKIKTNAEIMKELSVYGMHVLKSTAVKK